LPFTDEVLQLGLGDMAKNITTFFPYHIRTIFIMIFTTWVRIDYKFM